ncbi:MAG TPA: hypothetical protein VL294_05975 [Pseudolysinimonas sp.]|nr:hypothetical protein [Pseudolysinimonas sp.]
MRRVPARVRSARAGRAAASVAGLAIVVATVSVAAPALAFSDPPQLTIASGNPAAEDLGGLTFSGECPIGSDSAQLRWDIGTGPSVVPVTLDGSGAFAGLGPYFTGAAPGLGLAVTLDCLQGATSLGATFEDALYPDLGATIGGASSQPLDVAFAPTFDCGTAAATSTFTSASVTLYDPSDVQLDVVSGLPVPSGTGSGLGTPASYGLTVGDVVSLYLNCFAESGAAPFVAGYRSYTTTIATAAAPAGPPTPAAGGGGGAAQLAATGGDSSMNLFTAALAALLVTLGGGLVLSGRLRRRHGLHRRG